jgi:hypothetical protein
MRTELREILAVGIYGGKSRLGDRIEMLLRRAARFHHEHRPEVSLRARLSWAV